MDGNLFFTALSMLILILAYAGWMAWRQFSEHRAQVLHYDGRRRPMPRSTVCPSCHRRSYARRDIAQGTCSSCEESYTAANDTLLQA